MKIRYYDDKSYDLVSFGRGPSAAARVPTAVPCSTHALQKIMQPETVWFVKRCAGIKQCTNRPGHETVGAITLKHVYHIAENKAKDLPGIPLEQVCRMIIASCRSYGVKVVARPEDAPEFSP